MNTQSTHSQHESNDSRRGKWRPAGYAVAAAAGFSLAILLVANPFGIPFVSDLSRMLQGEQREPIVSDEVEPTGQLWTCGMHPEVLVDEPGQCPICGMNLVPVRVEEIPQTAPAQTQRHEEGEHDQTARQGAVVTIDPSVIQNMGVVTEEVTRKDLSRTIRTVGYLDYDQEKMVSITTKYEGFVEKVYVNYLGQPVRKGEPLFEIYAPQLVQTEQELLSALEFSRRMADAPEDGRRRAEALAAAARSRLDYWDITPEQIARLEETGRVFRTLEVVAPQSGVVMKRMPGLEGMAVRPGMEVVHIADLSSLWLEVEVFEDQLPWVREGSEASATLTYFPGKSFSGRIRFIEPEVSEKTRTVKLTLEVPNPDRRLRAGMYATVEFEPAIAENAISVPSYAVIRTGTRDVVVVALGSGKFAPREVELGAEGDGWIQVLAGLEEGEEIVTSSQFLIDSESNLREAVQKMVRGHAGHGH